ncbi:MAG: helix-turn-helix domain-containing protein [Acidimicrobiia bacterium]
MTPPGGARKGEPDPLVMSVAEAARLLGISKTLAYDLVARQELPSLRLGGRVRIPRRALERLTEGRREASPDVPQPARSGSARRGDRVPGPASGSSTDGGAPTRARSRRSIRRDHDSRSTTQLSLFDVPLPRPTPADTTPTTPPPAPTTAEPDPYHVLPPSNQPTPLHRGCVNRGRVRYERVGPDDPGELEVLRP